MLLLRSCPRCAGALELEDGVFTCMSCAREFKRVDGLFVPMAEFRNVSIVCTHCGISKPADQYPLEHHDTNICSQCSNIASHAHRPVAAPAPPHKPTGRQRIVVSRRGTPWLEDLGS